MRTIHAKLSELENWSSNSSTRHRALNNQVIRGVALVGKKKVLCIALKQKVYSRSLYLATGTGNSSIHLQSDHILVLRFLGTWTELREPWLSRATLTLPSQNVTITKSQQETESRTSSSMNSKQLKSRAKDWDFNTTCLQRLSLKWAGCSREP